MGQTTFSGPVVSQNGFIDSSFTDAERDAIVNPQPGLLIYNTTSNTYQVCTVGGSTPSWDSAFSGGGGGFPYAIESVVSQGIAWGGMSKTAMPVLFSPSGLQVTTVSRNMGIVVTYQNLTTPFDLSSAITQTSLPEDFSSYGSGIGSFFNATGTQYTCLLDINNGGQVNFTKYALTTPYDMSTATLLANGTAVSSQFSNDWRASAATLSKDGTKLIVPMYSSSTFNSIIYELQLSTPYDVSSGSTGNVYSFQAFIQNLTGPNSAILGLAFNPSGTVAYITTTGFGNPMLVEFKLGTPFDLLSISQSYTTTLSFPSSPVSSFQDYNWGVTVTGNSENLFIGFLAVMMGDPSYSKFNLTAVTAPNITSVSPTSGGVGSSVTITGTGFTSTTEVLFGSTPANFTVMSPPTEISATVPSGPSGLVDITVTNLAGTSNKSNAFTYTGPSIETFVAGIDYPPVSMITFTTQLDLNAPLSNSLTLALSSNAAAGKTIRLIGNGGVVLFETTVDSSSSSGGSGVLYFPNLYTGATFNVESFTLI